MHPRPGNDVSDRDRARQGRRGLGSRRLRTTAFAASVAVHVIAVLLYTTIVPLLRPDGATFPLSSDPDSEQRTPLIRLIDIEPEDVERPEDPNEVAELSASEAEVRPPFIAGPVVGELVPPGPTAAERLHPNLVDARLWAEPPPEFYALSVEEREELLLSSRIVEWYDSVALVRAADARLTDWTFTDSKGGRWGVADGKIYLGDVALPLPLNFGTPVGQRDFNARRIWEFEEIERQSQRFLIEESWKERAAAIRARRDRERALARGDTIGGR